MSSLTAADRRPSSTPSSPWSLPPPVYRYICIFKSGNRLFRRANLKYLMEMPYFSSRAFLAQKNCYMTIKIILLAAGLVLTTAALAQPRRDHDTAGQKTYLL